MQKVAGKLCTITFDEYASTSNKKFINNFCCNEEHINLGVARIKGSMPAKEIEDLVKKRLHEFALKMEDIVVAAIGEASAMKSFGRLICCVKFCKNTSKGNSMRS